MELNRAPEIVRCVKLISVRSGSAYARLETRAAVSRVCARSPFRAWDQDNVEENLFGASP